MSSKERMGALDAAQRVARILAISALPILGGCDLTDKEEEGATICNLDQPDFPNGACMGAEVALSRISGCADGGTWTEVDGPDYLTSEFQKVVYANTNGARIECDQALTEIQLISRCNLNKDGEGGDFETIEGETYGSIEVQYPETEVFAGHVNDTVVARIGDGDLVGCGDEDLGQSIDRVFSKLPYSISLVSH